MIDSHNFKGKIVAATSFRCDLQGFRGDLPEDSFLVLLAGSLVDLTVRGSNERSCIVRVPRAQSSCPPFFYLSK